MNDQLQAQLNRIEAKIDKHIESIAKMKTDISWLKKFFWTLSTLVIGSIVAALKNIFG